MAALYPALEKKMQRAIDLSFLSQDAIGNDVTFFGKTLSDARLQVAFSMGWMLRRVIDEDEASYMVIAPHHYECQKNSWAGIYKDITIDGCTISVPNYYYEDSVFMTGSR